MRAQTAQKLFVAQLLYIVANCMTLLFRPLAYGFFVQNLIALIASKLESLVKSDFCSNSLALARILGPRIFSCSSILWEIRT